MAGENKAPVTKEQVHLATLTIIEKELSRLHDRLRESGGDYDYDTVQEHISNLHDELISISQSLT